MIKRLSYLIFSLLITLPTLADGPKREMRATWFTTVNNIDWPTTQTAANQQKEMIKMLDSIRSLNLNAVFFQVRPCADALYNSAYEPWSSFLKINRGATPSYDPLQLMIDECHKRGMECHAWMNPYRYSRTGASWTGVNDSPLNYENTHPEWLLYFKNNIVMDPGLPEVRFRIKEVVGDLLSKYDVDGIIFDDYFYPYGGTTNQDSVSQRLYKPASMNVDDWRRDNVNRMVEDVYDTIQSVKPWVTFGISPFGIWTTSYTVARNEGITLPSNITGGNMYQEIYCDPVAWLKDGTVDYLSPQLYWKTGGSQDYKTLSKWWADLTNRFGVQFYSSMAIYKYSEKSDAAYTVSELENQTLLNRSASSDNAPGAVFYNTKGWVYDKPFRNAFRKNEFAGVALPPAINWKPATERTMVQNLTLEGHTLSWTHPDTDVHFAIYAVPSNFRNRIGVFSAGGTLIGISYTPSFTIPESILVGNYKIGVSVLDGYNNEYSLRILGEAEEVSQPTSLISPEPYAMVDAWPVTFSWRLIAGADSYVFQIARDSEFGDIVCTHETTSTSFSSATRTCLSEAGIYYWRVKARRPNANDQWSPARRLYLGVDGTGLEQQQTCEPVTKELRDGRILINKDGRTYDLLGHEVR